MSSVHGSGPRRIPTSRAYWELKAEQVMNRVFAPECSIDLEIVETRPTSPPAAAPTVVARQPATQPGATAQAWPPLSDRRLLLAAGLAVLGLGLAGGAAAGWGLWLQHQQALRQERNLLLIERLRNLGPPQATAEANPAPGPSAGSSGEGPELPPPPPDEPWMQELATLPASSAPAARVLKVPMSQTIDAPPPPARGTAGRAASNSSGAAAAGSAGGGGGSLPQLVGVIQIPGSGGSAIFQLGGSSTSAAVGESIGNSGWRLQSASGESAVIERAGEQRRLNISSGF